MKQTQNYSFTRYQVENDGINEPKVYSSITKRYLKPSITKNGYKQVTLVADNGDAVTMNFARFVMMLTNPQESYSELEVDHINRDKSDDRIENLRWISKSENRLNREKAKRPHRDCIITIKFDNGSVFEYTHKTKKLLNIPYITIYTLANAKEGSHYSAKYGITCYYKD